MRPEVFMLLRTGHFHFAKNRTFSRCVHRDFQHLDMFDEPELSSRQLTLLIEMDAVRMEIDHDRDSAAPDNVILNMFMI